MFRALLQQNNKVLTGLIASLLHLSPSEISSVEITNPIILGESINDKTFFLDIRVDLNQNTLINLEMQVINEHNWPERSLSYLCREFDQLSAGQSYESVKPAIQIGLLNFMHIAKLNGRICGAKRSHSVSEQPNCYQSV